jgi:hypothetical protein
LCHCTAAVLHRCTAPSYRTCTALPYCLRSEEKPIEKPKKFFDAFKWHSEAELQQDKGVATAAAPDAAAATQAANPDDQVWSTSHPAANHVMKSTQRLCLIAADNGVTTG